MPAKIEKRGENKYRFSVSQGRDAKGKQILRTKTISATSDREANKQYALFVAEIEKGHFSTSGKMTLREYYDYWQENYANPHHSAKTIVYNQGLFKRIDSALGHKRIDQIQAKHLLMFLSNLSEDGITRNGKLSQNTIRKYYVLLHTLFAKAVQWQLIGYNPADKIDKPKKAKTEKKIYDIEQTNKFLTLLEREELKHKLMIHLLLASGMRRGEMFGLRWKNVDFNENTIEVQCSVQYLPGKGTYISDGGETKNHNRIITLPGTVIKLLSEYRIKKLERRFELANKWEGSQKSIDDFIFTTWNGKVAHPDSINTWLKNFIAKHNLPKITPHSLRHMAATFLITAGTDLRTVAGKLGHANTTTTQIVYSHLLKESEKETAIIMEDVLNRVSKLK